MSEISREELIKRLETIVRDVEEDPSDLILSRSLSDLLEIVQGRLSDLSDQLDLGLFGLIFFLKMFFADNLFEDFIGEGIPREQGERLLTEIIKNIGQLINKGLSEDEKVMCLIGEMARTYCRLAEIYGNDDSDIDRMYL